LKWILIIAFAALTKNLHAQTVVYDRNHFHIVKENAAMRNVSEIGYHQSLEGIRKNTDDIGVNVASLAMVQTMIHRSLSEVNEVLKDAIQVKQMGRIIQQIYSISDQVIETASNDPILLLFAETYIGQAKERSLSLVSEVSAFILAEGNNVLINHNVRDELLTKVYQELQMINAYMLAVRNSMYWAKINGVLKKLNPYQAYINQDINLINQILIQKKTLER
jgi:hypothetical protein